MKKRNHTIISEILNIEGLSFRHFSGEDDYSAMANVHHDSKNFDSIDPFSILQNVPTATEIKEHIDDDNCNPYEDILISDLKGKVIGYCKTSWWTEKDDTWLFLFVFFLMPTWRHKGIDEAMLEWSESHLRTQSKKYSTHRKGMFGTSAQTTEIEKTDLLNRHGYKKAFSMIEMEFTDFNNLHDRRIPAGFTLRPVLFEHIRIIWEINNDVYAHRKFSEVPTEEDYREFLNNPNNDYSLWSVAWYGNDIAGFVLGSIDKGRGKLEEVSILEKYRRKGLAYTLIIKTLVKMKKNAAHRVRLSTNGENVAGAKFLHEKVGFQLVNTHIRYRKLIPK